MFRPGEKYLKFLSSIDSVLVNILSIIQHDRQHNRLFLPIIYESVDIKLSI